MTTPVPTRVAAPTRMPAGVRMSPVWRGPDGTLVEGAPGVEVPVDQRLNIAGWLWLCQRPDCPTVVWVWDEHAAPEQQCCTRHPLQLVPAPVAASDPDPVSVARTTTQGRLREMYQRRRQRIVEAAQARAEELRAAATAQARRTARELRGHVPSASVSVTGLLAGAGVVQATPAMLSAAVGVGVATAGAVVAYTAVLVAQRAHARLTGVDPADLRGRVGRRMRARARQVAWGVLALGGWMTFAAATGVDPGTVSGGVSLLLGVALVWAVNRRHWDDLWERRRRLAELARLRAEEAARRAAEEAARLAALADRPPSLVDESDPLVVGERMARRWVEVAQDPSVPTGFDMRRTRVVVKDTRRLEVPGPDGALVGYGWEFSVAADPGVLVARLGGGSPLIAAREWLAAMLDRDVSTVETAWTPATPNAGKLIVTDGLALAGTIAWKGPSAIRRTKDGTVFGHLGRALTGGDVEEVLYVPGQPSGGLTIGTTGSGKSARQRLKFLNLLAAGIFPVLHDPKEFEDYIDFIGVFPMVYTKEQRDVLLAALHAERSRRAKLKTTAPRVDRHGRRRTGDPVWNLRNGPPIRSVWDEFHMNVRDERFIASLTELVRTQRSTAVSADMLSQGGGLSDWADSNLRDLLGKASSTYFRVSDHLARLAGFEGEYSPSKLPDLPGVCLMTAPGVPAVPMRSAFVTRDDVDGEVYDYLYAPDGSPLLTAPELPAATVEVFESAGLMDLWRLGQGPDGAERLLSSTNTPDYAPPPPAVTQGVGPKPAAAHVVLAVLHATGGCTSATQITDHGVWASAPGWGRSPALSTVTRTALPNLTRDGLVATGPDGRIVLAGAGVERGRAWAEALGLVASSEEERPLPVGAVAERDAELRSEARTLAEAASS